MLLLNIHFIYTYTTVQCYYQLCSVSFKNNFVVFFFCHCLNFTYISAKLILDRLLLCRLKNDLQPEEVFTIILKIYI